MKKSSFIRPSNRGLALLATGGALAALLATSGCNRSAQAGAAGGGMMTPLVTVTAAQARDVPIYMDEPVGKAVATESVTIQPQVTGLLIARHFVDGAMVHKGQLLFEIDPRPFQAALDQAKANLAQAKAALGYAQNDYQRYLNLKGSPAVSQEEIEQKENTVEVDQANVEANAAGVETAQVSLDYCRISSPIDGRTGARLVDVGNVVTTLGGTSGATNLLTIQKLDPIYVDFTITENDLATVQQYMAKGTLHVEAQLPSDLVPNTAAAMPMTGPTTQTTPGAQSQPGVQPIGTATPLAMGEALPMAGPPRVGKLIFLDNAVQDGTGTVKLRAQLPNPDGHFWPGQFVNVRLVLTIQHGAVLIPAQAVQISQTGPFVYVVGEDKKAQLRPITTGQRQGTMVVVEGGVTAGENVIATGQMTVQPGGPVKVASGAAPGTPPPSAASEAPAAHSAEQKTETSPVKQNAGDSQS